jgi:hypothetical protein
VSFLVDLTLAVQRPVMLRDGHGARSLRIRM